MFLKLITFVVLGIVVGAVVFEKFGYRRRLARRQTCPKCGRHKIGAGPCGCGRDKG
ncbi:hypothetical protein [Gemmobacter caeruleus]|uniref:hypothetical protein n=1 Tax=Gemmobacter caeruleus TaxID=2595004 RepID=UPI00193AC5AF|nr:hypothetical protein [Gemmobacter caeruleus]